MKTNNKAAGELQSVVAILIGLIFLCVALNVLSYIWTYQKLSSAANNIAEICSTFGDTGNGVVQNKIKNAVENNGLKSENIKISFSGTEYSEGTKVDYGNKITVSLYTDKTALGMSGVPTMVEISTTKSKNSIFI